MRRSNDQVETRQPAPRSPDDHDLRLAARLFLDPQRHHRWTTPYRDYEVWPWLHDRVRFVPVDMTVIAAEFRLANAVGVFEAQLLHVDLPVQTFGKSVRDQFDLLIVAELVADEQPDPWSGRNGTKRQYRRFGAPPSILLGKRRLSKATAVVDHNAPIAEASFALFESSKQVNPLFDLPYAALVHATTR